MIPPANSIQAPLKASVVLCEQVQRWDREVKCRSVSPFTFTGGHLILMKGFQCSLWGEGTERNAYKLLLLASEAGSQSP